MAGIDQRSAGIVGVVAGLLGAAAGIWLALVPPRVGIERFSHPLDAPGFVALQLAFAVHHLGLVVAVLGLSSTSAVRTRTGRRALVAAVVGLVALAVLEVVACLGARSVAGSATVDSLNTAYGGVTLAIGIALTVLGVSVVRSGGWRGWRAWTPLLVGVYLFVPLTPLMAVGNDAARYGIAGWMLTFSLLGLALLTEPTAATGLDAPGSGRPRVRRPDRAVTRP